MSRKMATSRDGCGIIICMTEMVEGRSEDALILSVRRCMAGRKKQKEFLYQDASARLESFHMTPARRSVGT